MTVGELKRLLKPYSNDAVIMVMNGLISTENGESEGEAVPCFNIEDVAPFIGSSNSGIDFDMVAIVFEDADYIDENFLK